MSYLYVSDQGAVINFSDNRFHVQYKDNGRKSIPSETLEVIEVFGNVQLTTQCISACLKRGIHIIFFSTKGAYYGRVSSSNHTNVARQRKQAELGCEGEFALELSKKIIDAKINNQIVILRRYARSRGVQVNEAVLEMQLMRKKLRENAMNSDELIGYEGRAARVYFATLGRLINPEFRFNKRTKQPPLDPFNSMISLGYSILMNEIYGKIEAKGLNPYFGFLHKDREKHPTLASDLMEEWRAVAIDSTVMNMLNNSELSRDNFYNSLDQPGVFLDQEAFRKYLSKLEVKFRTEMKYLDYTDYKVSIRRGLDLQINQLCRAIEKEDVSEYMPIYIR